MQGGSKASYIWTTNGSRWFVIDSTANNFILAESYAFGTSTWAIPKSRFDAEFIPADDVPKINQVIQHQPIAGWSTRKLNSAFTGNANTIRRDSDDATQAIGFINNYSYDVQSFQSFVGAANAFCTIQNDQFGSTNLEQPTLANQPQVTELGGANNQPFFFYDGVNCLMFNLALQAVFNGDDKPYTIATLVRKDDVSSNGNIFSAGSTVSAPPHVGLDLDDSAEVIVFRRDDANTPDLQTVTNYMANDYMIIVHSFDGSTYRTLINNQLFTQPALNLGQITPNAFAIAAFVSTAIIANLKGRIDEFLLWDSNIGTDDMQRVSTNINQFYGVYKV